MTLLDVLLVLLALSLLPAVGRMVVGPTAADRAMAADHAFFVLVAVLALLAVRLPTPGLLDVVVVEEPGVKEILSLAPAALSGSDYLDEDRS